MPGLKQFYGVDPTATWSSCTDADAGIQALDDGLADVAVAFSSNPELSRPDIVTLRDDKRMIGPDRVVPAVRSRAPGPLRGRPAQAPERGLARC